MSERARLRSERWRRAHRTLDEAALEGHSGPRPPGARTGRMGGCLGIPTWPLSGHLYCSLTLRAALGWIKSFVAVFFGLWTRFIAQAWAGIMRFRTTRF